MPAALAALLSDEASAGLAPSGYLWSLLQMLGALLLVCLLAYALLRALRRVSGHRPSAGTLRVLERCPLSPRHSLWLVDVGGRCFLLGSNDGPGGGVSRLAELDPAEIGAPQIARSGAARSFGEVLRRLRDKGGPTGGGPSAGAPQPPEAP